MKEEHNTWYIGRATEMNMTNGYHKTLKGIETMIDVQRMVKDIKRMAEEANTMITEIEGSILMASINNRVTNTTNITQILEDL